MVSSCLATLPQRPSLLKRVRSPSLMAALERENPAVVIKASKRTDDGSPRSTYDSSPRSACDVVTPRFSESKCNDKSEMEQVPWPTITSCEGLRNAIAFLQNSKQHALLLMVQNHWERAMGVLEKVETATESVSMQRRKLVLQQANQFIQPDLSSLSLNTEPKKTRRSVQFCDDVQVIQADEVDRSSWEIQSPAREEMLVLRASRPIPRENYSELWH
ncbi:hypothetical protein Poli38472_006582 [Pythium oligandrum]|uniref:Uncharacterized protein n=1 Tax=Pythium oligandrum TaxID=41045 RepID=A0A8K1C4W2_PYTOL|nr:hypothetical protein Poli38472_006582 [Pythium oligandrum]|eukprot:TMW56572.1 hypothetical protein Poli38472_006582 [Pythium oligandrum]